MARVLLVVVLCLASTAMAVEKGGPLYVVGKDVKLLKEPKAKAKVLRTLQSGTEVKWLGASAKDKHFHEVEVDGKKGFVLQGNLSPSRPMLEVSENGGRISAAAFAAAGAATTKDGPEPVRPVLNGPQSEAAWKQLQQLEELNKSITPDELQKKQQELREAK